MDDFKFPEMAPMPAMMKDMTLRDYFAAKALQELLTRIQMSGSEQARQAYIVADAMLKARGTK